MVNLFEYSDYKAYLRALIKKSDVRGFSSRLAEAAGCQKSYFSSSLGGKSHLLPDHIYGIAEFLQLAENERDYLILILDYQRANVPAYRKFIFKKIQERQNSWRDLKNRLNQPSLVKPGDESVLQNYYSNYLYAAIHIAVSIPQLQDPKSLAQYFSLPEKLVQAHLDQLVQMGLVRQVGHKWAWHSGDLHLPKDSPWIQTHHSGWRLQALRELTLRNPDSLHYSIVQSLSHKDIEALRFQMVKWIQDFRKVSGPSAPEELVCFNLDFFNVGKKN